MFKFGYKLVRDRIPAIIEQRGEKPIVAFLSSNGLVAALKAKLLEEALEVHDASDKELAEELGDVLEVVFSIASKVGITKKQLTRVRNEKRKKNGGFKKGILLKC
jgi:predicted house-cleaning noncanonical NTP pyrophosphatase (MazG superfamily)